MTQTSNTIANTADTSNTRDTAATPGDAPAAALILVDVQPTFCEGGELPVAGGNAVADAVAEYVRRSRDRYAAVVTTQDWHIDPGAHFSSDPDFVDSWPPHGLAGTSNAGLHPALQATLDETGPADITIRKGQHAAAYSGFEGTTELGQTLLDALRAHGVTAVDVCGIAESHCVKDTALDAVAAGLHVRVLTDLTVPVTAEMGAAAREHLATAGVTLTASNNEAAHR